MYPLPLNSKIKFKIFFIEQFLSFCNFFIFRLCFTSFYELEMSNLVLVDLEIPKSNLGEADQKMSMKKTRFNKKTNCTTDSDASKK